MPNTAPLGSQDLPQPTSVLLVDHDLGFRRSLAATLTMAGYVVVETADGEEARRILLDVRVDAILLNQSLPGISCPENCRRIRALRGLAETPLLIVANRDDSASVIQALDAGADDYVLKSIDLEVLKARLRVNLRRCGILSKLEKREAAQPAPADREPLTDRIELDPEALTRLQESVDVEGVIELIDALLADAPKRLAALFAALERKDAAVFVSQVHQIKSNTATFGGTRLAAECAEIEALGRTGRLAEVPRAAALLKSRFERFWAELRAARNQRAEKR